MDRAVMVMRLTCRRQDAGDHVFERRKQARDAGVAGVRTQSAWKLRRVDAIPNRRVTLMKLCTAYRTLGSTMLTELSELLSSTKAYGGNRASVPAHGGNTTLELIRYSRSSHTKDHHRPSSLYPSSIEDHRLRNAAAVVCTSYSEQFGLKCCTCAVRAIK